MAGHDARPAARRPVGPRTDAPQVDRPVQSRRRRPARPRTVLDRWSAPEATHEPVGPRLATRGAPMRRQARRRRGARRCREAGTAGVTADSVAERGVGPGQRRRRRPARASRSPSSAWTAWTADAAPSGRLERRRRRPAGRAPTAGDRGGRVNTPCTPSAAIGGTALAIAARGEPGARPARRLSSLWTGDRVKRPPTKSAIAPRCTSGVTVSRRGVDGAARWSSRAVAVRPSRGPWSAGRRHRAVAGRRRRARAEDLRQMSS